MLQLLVIIVVNIWASAFHHYGVSIFTRTNRMALLYAIWERFWNENAENLFSKIRAGDCALNRNEYLHNAHIEDSWEPFARSEQDLHGALSGFIHYWNSYLLGKQRCARCIVYFTDACTSRNWPLVETFFLSLDCIQANAYRDVGWRWQSFIHTIDI